MKEKIEFPRKRALSRRALIVLAGALVVVLGLVIGLNVGGLRERLVWRIMAPRIESIAVLPLENLSHDPAQDYFADGVTATLIIDLGQIGTLRVIDRSSVLPYKIFPKALPEIAQELNVDGIVEGSVLRSGGRVRITADLIHAPANRRLWRQTYERDLGDILGLQAEVSRAVARKIGAKLTPQQEARLTSSRRVNPQAHESYLLGTYRGNPAKAEEYYKQATQLDPAYAPPYYRLAYGYYWNNYFPTLPPRDTFPKAKEAAQKALSLDPTLAGPNWILAMVAEQYDRNFSEAERLFKREIEVYPNSSWAHHYYAHFLLSTGRMKEASAETRRALEINPMSWSNIACTGLHCITEGNYKEGEKQCLRALSMGASDTYARVFLGWAYEQEGRFDEAITEFQKAIVGWGSGSTVFPGGAVFPTAVLGHAYAAAGKESEAREVLNGLLARSKKEYVSAFEIATIYAGLGERDRAFEWLEKAYEERANFLVHFRMDPRIWSLQSDPRFQALLRRMSFPL